MSEAVVADILFTRLDALVTTPATLLVVENRSHPTSGPYLAASLVPARTVSEGIGAPAGVRHSGDMQVAIFGPEDAGPHLVRTLAAQVVAWFARGTVLTGSGGAAVRIISPPWTTPMLPEPGWLQLPVYVPWVADFPNPG